MLFCFTLNFNSMNNSFENFYCFMTLLVAKGHFKQDILENEGALRFFHKIMEAPEALGRLTTTMADKAEAYDKVMKPNKLLWEIYKADGETALRGILDALEALKDFDPNDSSDD